ncbi:MAG: dihydrofolate reductase [Lawsonibacter sp.]|jgi:dihydrofolate reductase|nr:dihydrofolate reductase [Lawsonibacter sp.]MCI9294203.1 dihydrofolate reductase [Lawsonibacter sp.]
MKVIAAVDENWAIGRNGDQLIYISEDLKHFKALTTGHPVILGRKTLATFPGGRPLKGRRNLILSRNPGFAPPEAEVFSSLEELLAAAPQDAFVIGGASVYQALLDRCDTACITRIEAAFPGADCWFPNLDERPEWKIAEEGPVLEEKGVRFRYVTYERA